MYSQQNIPPQGSAAAMQIRLNNAQQQQQQMHPQQNGSGSQQTHPQQHLQPSFPDTTKFVLDYMKKRGYSRSETESRLENAKFYTPPITLNNPLSVQYEVPNASNVPKSIRTPLGASIPIGGPIAGPLGKTQPLMEKNELNWLAYNALHEWVRDSIDFYQWELERVLFPIFALLYLDLIQKRHLQQAKEFLHDFSSYHSEEQLAKLSNVGDENDAIFKEKFDVEMSRASFDLMLFFLTDLKGGKGSMIIRQMNARINIIITGPEPNKYAVDEDEDVDIKIEDSSMVLDEESTQDKAFNLFSPNSNSLLDEFTGLMPKDSDFSASDTNLGLSDSTPKPNQRSKKPKKPKLDIMPQVKAMIENRNRLKPGVLQTTLPSVSMYTFHDPRESLNTLEFSNNSTTVAAGFSDSFIKIWDLNGRKLESVIEGDYNNGPKDYQRLVGHAGAVYGLSFSPDDRFLLSASEDKSVRLWSLETFQNLVCYKSHGDPVWDVQFSPFGHYFATASNDQTARLWSTDRIYPLRIFAGHLSDVDNVIFHPNGKYIVTGSHDRTARMWDINSGAVVRIFPGHTKPISCTAISPDGRWLATASEDSTIYLWDLGSSRRIKSMRGHGKCSIYSLTFSPDGDTLISAGSDCTVRVWDVRKSTYDQGPEPEPFGSVTGADATNAGPNANNASSVNGKAGSISGPSGGKLDGLFDLDGKRKKEIMATPDHLVVYNTRKTPVYRVKYTKGNMCIAGGVLTE